MSCLYKTDLKYNFNRHMVSKHNNNDIKNPDKINWDNLSRNKNAIEILKQNREKIHWRYLSRNKNANELLKN